MKVSVSSSYKGAFITIHTIDAMDRLNKIMNIQLPITNGHVLMATDALESLGHKVNVGNNVTISLDLDSKEEAEKWAEENGFLCTNED